MVCAIIAKTELGMERYIANSIDVDCEVVPAPKGFSGLILLKRCKDFDKAFKKLLEFPEVIRIMKAQVCTKADVESLKRAALELSKYVEGKRFAVRTVRRGKHDFTSIQVNAELGATVLSAVNAKVDLENPDVVLMVEIIGDEAYLSVVEPEYAGMKKLKGKISLKDFFRKVRVVQEPYVGPLKSVHELGKRIGRIVQSYGVKEYYVGLIEPVNALELAELVKSIIEGAKSRFIQRKKAEGDEDRTEIKVFDMYHLVGSRSKKEVVIVFEPEGKSFEEVIEEVGKKVAKAKKVTLVLGSRKGVPMGLYRFADYVIDIAPGIVLSTETALAAALESVALAYLHSKRSDVGPSLPLSGPSERGQGVGTSSYQQG